MSPESKPIIAIAGSLSKQGRSVAHSLLRSGRYRVRALTGRTDSPEAIKLAEQGAELIAVPLAAGRKDDFVRAFEGTYGVFLLTPGIVPPETSEFDIGRELADAAVRAGVQHIVFSSLENVDTITSGKKFARHFTDKARVEAYIRGLSLQSSFVELAFFYTNLLEFYPPRMVGDTLVFPIYLPEHFRAPFVDPLTATGPAVLEIFDHPDFYAGQTLPVIGDVISPAEMVETFSHVSGHKAAYASAYRSEQFRQYFPDFSLEFVHETMGMVEYAVEYGYFRLDRDAEWSRRINPGSLNWEQFLRETGWNGQKRSSAFRTAALKLRSTRLFDKHREDAPNHIFELDRSLIPVECPSCGMRERPAETRLPAPRGFGAPMTDLVAFKTKHRPIDVSPGPAVKMMSRGRKLSILIRLSCVFNCR